jgi:hypothetical protein
MSDLVFDRIIRQVKKLLGQQPMTTQELMFEIKDYDEEQVLQVLRWLEDNKKVKRQQDLRYVWRKQYRLRL